MNLKKSGGKNILNIFFFLSYVKKQKNNFFLVEKKKFLTWIFLSLGVTHEEKKVASYTTL